MPSFHCADVPSVLSRVRHLSNGNFQHEIVDERLVRRHHYLTKLSGAGAHLQHYSGSGESRGVRLGHADVGPDPGVG